MTCMYPPHMTCMYPPPPMTCMYPPPHMTCMYPPPHLYDTLVYDNTVGRQRHFHRSMPPYTQTLLLVPSVEGVFFFGLFFWPKAYEHQVEDRRASESYIYIVHTQTHTQTRTHGIYTYRRWPRATSTRSRTTEPRRRYVLLMCCLCVANVLLMCC